MMNYAYIRNGIVDGLNEHLQIPVVPTDTNQPKPPYPFVSYKFTTLYKSDASVMTRQLVTSGDENFNQDIEYVLRDQPQMVLSINAYSLDEAEAYDLALRVRAWFKLHGYRYLKELELIVVNVTALQDRSILIVDNYEKRIGFDVTLRTYSEDKARGEGIEVYAIEGR